MRGNVYLLKGRNEMTIYVTFLTNDRAQLINSEMRFSGLHAREMADMAIAMGEAKGFIVRESVER